MRAIKLTLLLAAMLSVLPGCKQCCRRLGDCRLFNRKDATAPRFDPPATTRPVDPFLIPPPEGGLPTPSVGDAAPPPPAAGRIVPSDLPPPVVPETRNRLPETKGSDLPPPVVPETYNKTPEKSGSALPPPIIPETRNKTPEKNGTAVPPPVVPDTHNPTPEKKGKELVLPDPLPGFESPSKPSISSKIENTKPPVGVTGFAQVRDGIATGRKPSLDGIDSLKNAGYRTVIYLHTAGADVDAVKSVVEKRGLTFHAVAVDADTMKTAASSILDLVGDSKLKPMYICDDDGARTGTLWYAYYRAIEGMSDDAAQVKAAPLGLRDAGPEKAKLLAAAQELLSKK